MGRHAGDLRDRGRDAPPLARRARRDAARRDRRGARTGVRARERRRAGQGVYVPLPPRHRGVHLQVARVSRPGLPAGPRVARRSRALPSDSRRSRSGLRSSPSTGRPPWREPSPQRARRLGFSVERRHASRGDRRASTSRVSRGTDFFPFEMRSGTRVSPRAPRSRTTASRSTAWIRTCCFSPGVSAPRPISMHTISMSTRRSPAERGPSPTTRSPSAFAPSATGTRPTCLSSNKRPSHQRRSSSSSQSPLLAEADAWDDFEGLHARGPLGRAHASRAQAALPPAHGSVTTTSGCDPTSPQPRPSPPKTSRARPTTTASAKATGSRRSPSAGPNRAFSLGFGRDCLGIALSRDAFYSATLPGGTMEGGVTVRCSASATGPRLSGVSTAASAAPAPASLVPARPSHVGDTRALGVDSPSAGDRHARHPGERPLPQSRALVARVQRARPGRGRRRERPAPRAVEVSRHRVRQPRRVLHGPRRRG